VGFYSSFMVSDRVTVLSRKAAEKSNKAIKWESAADGTFTVDETTREKPGTDVILRLKSDEKKYLDEWEIREVVRKYSDYIEHPVVMDVTREKPDPADKDKRVTTTEEEILNARKAIWLKDLAEITPEEYHDFYKHVSHDYSDPAKVIHYRAEGTSEFTALLYIPQHAPYGILYRDFKVGPMLYVKRVQIMDHCAELLPEYLRFVRGVVDSSDLPLNVSREILQNNRHMTVIKKNVTKKILDNLADMKKNDAPAYEKLHREFGRVLKEGIHFEPARKEEIADLLLFTSTKTEKDKYTTLSDYVRDMPIAQDAIYYIVGTKDENVLQSPYLEAFRSKGYEVLVLTDDIDDLIMLDLGEYKGKKVKNVVKGDVHLDKTTETEKKEQEDRFGKLLVKFRERLKDEVKDVRLSGRLTDSAACLVADEGGMDPQMEKLLKSMGQDVPAQKRILELNPGHPVFETMKGMLESGSEGEVQEYIDLLYIQSLLLEGSKLKDPAGFARSVAKLMTGGAGKK
jgi:molecular chaperone HtpG